MRTQKHDKYLEDLAKEYENPDSKILVHVRIKQSNLNDIMKLAKVQKRSKPEMIRIILEERFCSGECYSEWMSDNRYEFL